LRGVELCSLPASQTGYFYMFCNADILIVAILLEAIDIQTVNASCMDITWLLHFRPLYTDAAAHCGSIVAHLSCPHLNCSCHTKSKGEHLCYTLIQQHCPGFDNERRGHGNLEI
jgi:hypothetical protein